MIHELSHGRQEDARADQPSNPRGRATGLLFAYSCAVAALMLAIDLGSKQLALRFLDTETRIPLLGDLFGLQLAFNTGAAFSLGSQLTPIITLLGLVATVFLIRAASRTQHRVTAVAIGLILGGALGNLVDRLVAPSGIARGAVTDFLAYGHLFIGNIADIAIGVGVVIYLLGTRWIKARSLRRPDPFKSSAVSGAVELPASAPVATTSSEIPGHE